MGINRIPDTNFFIYVFFKDFDMPSFVHDLRCSIVFGVNPWDCTAADEASKKRGCAIVHTAGIARSDRFIRAIDAAQFSQTFHCCLGTRVFIRINDNRIPLVAAGC